MASKTLAHIPTGYVDFLKTFIRFQSVSTDAAYDTECIATAHWLTEQFIDKGFVVETWDGDNTHPVVVARYVQDDSLETVLVYGHYDVQPANTEDGWLADPFHLHEEKGKVYARGAVDNKGQVAIHIATVFDLIDRGELGKNVIFVIEGNEESGNDDLEGQLKQYKKTLKADVILVSDGEISGKTPVLESSFRGGGNMKVVLRTAKNHLHSGIHGGVVPNAALELSKVLGMMKDDSNKVKITGFYNDVPKISKKQKAEYAAALTAKEQQKVAGTKHIFEGKDPIAVSLGLRPTLEISGITSGYTGTGFLNIVPSWAEARVNVRTAPGQHTKKMMKSIVDFIKDKTPNYVKVEFELEPHGDAVMLDLDNNAANNVKGILKKVYKKEVILKHVGGSIPVIGVFAKLFKNTPILSVSLGNDDCNMHGVNENFTIGLIEKGLQFSEGFFKKSDA